MSLEEFTKQIPPGWRPGISRYSFKKYLQKLRLWWRFADTTEIQAGPLIAARLGGLAFDRAMSLRINRAGTIHVGEDAIAQPREAEITDPTTGVVIQEAQESGASILIAALRAEFEIHTQDQQTTALDAFFDLRRDQNSLSFYCTEYRMLLEEATEKAGLDINNVAKTHIFLKHSGLPERKLEDIRLRVGGDLQRFDEIITLVQRFAKSEAAQHSPAGRYNYADEWYDDDDDDHETY